EIKGVARCPAPDPWRRIPRGQNSDPRRDLPSPISADQPLVFLHAEPARHAPSGEDLHGAQPDAEPAQTPRHRIGGVPAVPALPPVLMVSHDDTSIGFEDDLDA